MTKKDNDDILNLLIKNSSSQFTSSIDKSEYFKREREIIPTSIPLLNLALAGDMNEGLSGGILTIAGESKRFKTLFGLYLIAAFQKKYPDGVCMFYDTEFGSPPDYLEIFGLNLKRIVWTPITCVEELKHECASQLEKLKEINNKDNHVMIFIDSVGNLASRKERDDAIEGKEKVDMTRAKQLKSFFRIVTGSVKLLDIPLVAINHTYKSQSFIPEDIVSGGQGILLASDNVWIITRKQIKDGTERAGNEFIINVNKSRFVKEKSKFPISVYWQSGIHKYSGLSELAKEFKIIKEEKEGKTKMLKYKDKSIPEKGNDENEEFWSVILNETNLNELVMKKYKLIYGE